VGAWELGGEQGAWAGSSDHEIAGARGHSGGCLGGRPGGGAGGAAQTLPNLWLEEGSFLLAFFLSFCSRPSYASDSRPAQVSGRRRWSSACGLRLTIIDSQSRSHTGTGCAYSYLWRPRSRPARPCRRGPCAACSTSPARSAAGALREAGGVAGEGGGGGRVSNGQAGRRCTAHHAA
jgi:hypothetical protein